MAKNNYQTIVLKIGSSTLTGQDGQLDLVNFKRIIAEVAELIRQKKHVIIVTSGAVALGSQKLKLGQPKTIPQKQAAAAVGQSVLMRQYEKAFEEFGLTVAQVLLTGDVIAGRERAHNARNCISMLLHEGVVPIVNENDTVAIEEIKIGDNDNLAALTASLIGADLLIVLTDVDSFYLKNEEGIPYPISEVSEITEAIKDAAGHPSTQLGTGGMVTKIQAAEVCLKAGINLVIMNGKKPGLIEAAAAGEKVGTIFLVRPGIV